MTAELLWQGRCSRRSVVPAAVFFTVVLAAFLFGASAASEPAVRRGLVFLGVLGTGPFFVVIALYAMLAPRMGRYDVTATDLRALDGLLSRRETRMQRQNVQEVRVSQTFAQRLLAIGDVVVMSAGAHIRFSNVREPGRVMALLQPSDAPTRSRPPERTWVDAA